MKAKKTDVEKAEVKENVMRKVSLEKVVLSMGAKAEGVDKGIKLLGIITGKKPVKIKSKKRIPAFNVRPGLEVGCIVTIRDKKEMAEIIRRMLAAIENKLKKKQIADNHFSFGVHEYIEIPGIEYYRDIGMMGLDVTLSFKRAGKRVKLRKMKKGKFPKKQIVTKKEIIKYMEEKFGTKFR